MKKLLFALPILALSFFAAFCSKENVTVPAELSAAPESAGDRGGPATCSVTITVHGGKVTVCGLANNATACQNCSGANLVGSDVLSDPGTSTITYTVNAGMSTPFSISYLGGSHVTVDVATNGAAQQTWSIDPNQCNGFAVSPNCGLVADRAPL